MITPNDEAVLNSIFDPTGLATCSGNQDKSEGTFSPYRDDPKLRQIELDAVQKAESGRLEEAISSLTSLIHLHPERASSYNNRAQVYRLLGNTELAEADLEKALSKNHQPKEVTSQVLGQRAVLRELRGDESGALNDYKQAASLGSHFARQQLVRLNPDAKLCNQMVAEMIKQVENGASMGK